MTKSNKINICSSTTSSTVADPSTVTVRIENASNCDLNVQDVLTASSSSSSSPDDFKHRQDSIHGRRGYRTSIVENNANASQRSRTSSRIPQNRPITAVSLPAKTSAYDNEWDLDSARTLVTSNQRRNPSYPVIPPEEKRVRSPTQSIFIAQQVPTVFTTTSEYLGKELRPQPRRSQSLARPVAITHPASPTTPIVLLTDDILLGSIRALQNERQLCKLSVDYLIDATNMRPDELARKANVGARLPCQCGHAHSRCTLTLEFDSPYLTTAATASTDASVVNSSKLRDSNRTQLDQLFAAITRFIAKAQQEEKRILIYGFELTPNSPLAFIAIQYLMLANEQLSLSEATHRIHRLFPILPMQHQQFPIMEKRFQETTVDFELSIPVRRHLLVENRSVENLDEHNRCAKGRQQQYPSGHDLTPWSPC